AARVRVEEETLGVEGVGGAGGSVDAERVVSAQTEYGRRDGPYVVIAAGERKALGDPVALGLEDAQLDRGGVRAPYAQPAAVCREAHAEVADRVGVRHDV